MKIENGHLDYDNSFTTNMDDSGGSISEFVSGAAYRLSLDKKLLDSVSAYLENKTLNNLANLADIVQEIVESRGWTMEQLEAIRSQRDNITGNAPLETPRMDIQPTPGSYSLAELISKNQATILAKLDIHMMETYFWLMRNLHTRNVSEDLEYRRKFGGYYRMRFVSQEYRDTFFSVFEEYKDDPDPSFTRISELLYQVDGKHEFSFISKMLHTIDPRRPIYDSQVDAALGIHRTYQTDFQKKLHQDEEILRYISVQYTQLVEAPEIQEVIASFDKLLMGRKMTIEKKLDFILWALGAPH